MDSMDKRDFFEYWNESFRTTRSTIECFPEAVLGEVLVRGLRPPGRLFAHIFSHVNAVFNACVRQELLVSELNQIPDDLDVLKRASLVHYAQRTMEGLLAHGSVDVQIWKQRISTPWGGVPMENLCIASFAHEIHHRGQLFVMLRLLGIEPPAVCRHSNVD